MMSPQVLELDRAIRALSIEEQKWLLDRINKQIRNFTDTDKFANESYIEAQIKEMACDPDIQAEIAAINQEFAVTEMDGLSD
ncbi:MAG: hypothetical protein EBE86_028605 [Hormoscilla sp. GUM202]|nr:hypothetical protein [Hormoscilla sp. GUM202]